MRLQRKLELQAQQFLQDGELTQAVFRAQSSFSVWEARASRCPMWHLIVVTNLSVLVVDLSFWTNRPLGLRLRYCRNVYFGRSRAFDLDGKRYWVVENSDQLGRADLALAEMLRHQCYKELILVGHREKKVALCPPGLEFGSGSI